MTPPSSPAAKAPAPAPTPTPKPAEPTPTFSGSVVVAVFSDVITTGEAKASAASSLEWDKVEASLKRVDGVTNAAFDAGSRRINVTYTGPFAGIEKIRNAAQNSGASCELLNPAKLIFRPMGQIEDESKLLSAIRGVSGVTTASKDLNDITFYADLSSLDLDAVTKAALGAGVKGQIVTHEVLKQALPAGGNPASLTDELGKTKWILKAEVDSSTNELKVLAVKGRVTRALVKSIMTKCGYPETK
jgi:copper chaperone CopZ